jgi:hypothetical protein
VHRPIVDDIAFVIDQREAVRPDVICGDDVAGTFGRAEQRGPDEIP